MPLSSTSMVINILLITIDVEKIIINGKEYLPRLPFFKMAEKFGLDKNLTDFIYETEEKKFTFIREGEAILVINEENGFTEKKVNIDLKLIDFNKFQEIYRKIKRLTKGEIIIPMYVGDYYLNKLGLKEVYSEDHDMWFVFKPGKKNFEIYREDLYSFPIGKFIGKGGKNIKKLAQKIGASFIKII